jgi:hypothetical protein
MLWMVGVGVEEDDDVLDLLLLFLETFKGV